MRQSSMVMDRPSPDMILDMEHALLLVALLATLAPAQTLKTRWTSTVTPENAWREYPRPAMVRKDWTNLNGLWRVSIWRPNAAPIDGKILVPFAAESQLSRFQHQVGPGEVLSYSRTFTKPAGERVLLHFGAVDWQARVLVNGKEVGTHRGGYDPFSFDITPFLRAGARQTLEVEVTDPTDSGYQPRGKQVLKPGGIFYTPCTGIWQTVWLEGVPQHSIEGLNIQTSIDGTLKVGISTRSGPAGPKLRSFFSVELRDGAKKIVARAAAGGTAVLKVPRPKLWSPERPTLYPITVKWAGDEVTSYCAFREVGLIKDQAGQPRIALNGKPYFMVGPLDQGFWPDGIYTPPSDEAMKYDLDVTKRLGFNMIRKHVKVESERWYYWCDKLGICVFQDMPAGDKYIGGNDPDITRSAESAQDFRDELKSIVDSRRNHPCIISWVLYNEGWGQWKTAEMTQWLKKHDPGRLVDSASGWTDRGTGDLSDVHVYPGPGAPKNESGRAIFLGEFGGLGLPTPGHMWKETGWGYQSFKTKEELTARFVDLFTSLHLLIGSPGLSGAVYTQTTDVETELNGLMTYDRAMIKLDEPRARNAILALFSPPPVIEQIVPTSEGVAATWKYVQSARSPGEAWFKSELDDSDWLQGSGGFGTAGTPGSIVRTRWDTTDIFMRRRFVLSKDYPAGEVMLRLSHDDEVEVYLDGRLLFKAPGWTTSYLQVPIPASFAMTQGAHVLAVHCTQHSGGQYVDAGLVRLVPGRETRPARSDGGR